MSQSPSDTPSSPYPRNNYWGEIADDHDDTAREDELPPVVNSRAEFVTHRIRKYFIEAPCYDGRTLLRDPDSEDWHTHHENVPQELSDPKLIPPGEGQRSHRYRVNEETGYLNYDQDTWIELGDVDTETFLTGVREWLAQRDGRLDDDDRKAVLRVAKQRKHREGLGDKEALKDVVRMVNRQERPQYDNPLDKWK